MMIGDTLTTKVAWKDEVLQVELARRVSN